jgi:AcrR family transcriptional regulator
MTSKKSDTYHHGNLKESLVTTALEMLDQNGLEAITLRELASRLGTSRSAIYRHFKGKNDLMRAVILEGFIKLDQALAPHFDNTERPLLERFHDMGASYTSFATTNPNLYRLLFGPDMSQEREEVCQEERPDLHKLLNNNADDTFLNAEPEDAFHRLVKIIIEAQQKELFKEGDPVLFATAIWSMLHGLSMLAIDGNLSVVGNVEAIYEMNYKLLLEGIAKV